MIAFDSHKSFNFTQFNAQTHTTNRRRPHHFCRYCSWPSTLAPTRQHCRHAPSWPPPLHRWRRPCQPTPCSCLQFECKHTHTDSHDSQTFMQLQAINSGASTSAESGSTVAATAPTKRASATSWRLQRIINNNNYLHWVKASSCTMPIKRSMTCRQAIYTNPVNQQSTTQIHNQEKHRMQHIGESVKMTTDNNLLLLLLA